MWLGVLLGVAYWLAESALHAFALGHEPFLQALVPNSTNEIWMRTFTVALFIAGGLLVQAYLDRLRAHQEQTRKLARAVEHAAESIVITNLRGEIEYANPAFTRITGYQAPEVVGRTPAVLKSGAASASFYREMWATISSGRPWSGRLTDKRKDGSYYPLQLTIAPITSDEGKMTHYVGIQRDLTTEVALEDDLRGAERMVLLGTLAGGMAHDFNNVLATIKAYVGRAQELTASPDEIDPVLRGIDTACDEAAAAIRQMLGYARAGRDASLVEDIHLRQWWEGAEGVLRLTLPRAVKLQTLAAPEEITVRAVPGTLQQALQNLLTNAADALEGHPEPRVEVSFAALADGAQAAPPLPTLTGVPCVRISVRDNGPGVPDDLQPKVLEPFFTTKGVGRGTGLGLAMVAETARTFGGELRLESRAGEGATFSIFLPQGEPLAESAPPERRPKGDEMRVLLVDDQDRFRITTRILLEGLECGVIEARDGTEAVEVFREHATDLDVVMMDVSMPNLSGVEAGKRMRTIRPDVPLLFLTGHDDGRVARGGLGGRVATLVKPFRVEQLSQALRDLLDGSSIPSPR